MVRSFLAGELSHDILAQMHETGTLHSDTFHKALAERGWVGLSWPAQFGGADRSTRDIATYFEEAYYAGAPVDGHLITYMVGTTILKFGTPQQQERFVQAFADGRALACLGYTEPDSGSDLASVRTSARRSGDHYVVNGAKIFTTLAHVSDYVFLLARTDPDAERHRGLSMFLVPMPDVDVKPIHTMGGERTNATFYDDVRVPVEHRIGAEGQGWEVVTGALVVERASMAGFLGQARRVYDDIVMALGPDDLQNRAVAAAVARAGLRIRAAAALVDRVVDRLDGNDLDETTAAKGKLAITEAFRATAELGIHLVGDRAVTRRGPYDAVGRLENNFRHSVVSTIYGGTSEIMRNIIARRGLGLGGS